MYIIAGALIGGAFGFLFENKFKKHLTAGTDIDTSKESAKNEPPIDGDIINPNKEESEE